MTSAAHAAETASSQPTIKRQPIRGLLYGLMFGLGLAFVAIGQGFAALGTWPPFLLLLAGLVIGTAWSMFGPAKGAAAPAAPATATPPTNETEADALDDRSEID